MTPGEARFADRDRASTSTIRRASKSPSEGVLQLVALRPVFAGLTRAGRKGNELRRHPSARAILAHLEEGPSCLAGFGNPTSQKRR